MRMNRGLAVLVWLGFTVVLPLRAEPPAAGAAALNHVAIYVRNPDRSAAFYRDVFGLQQVTAPVPFARWLVMGNRTMLHIVGGRPTPVANARWDHFALSVFDLNAFITRLDAKGITWSDLNGRPVPQSDIRGRGLKQIFLHDPDGYWIEVNDAQPK
jgi:lactoylglutathione lyase